MKRFRSVLLTRVDSAFEVSMMFRFGLLMAALALTGAACSAQDVAAKTPATANVPYSVNAHPLRLSAGDLIQINTLGTELPAFNQKLRVSDQGTIALSYVPPVNVAGRTAEDAGLLIEATWRDKNVLLEPHVTVTVEEYATQGVTVGGEVKTPGVYPLLGTHNLMDLLANAGGVSPTAGKAVTISHRDDPGHPQVVSVETKPGSTAAYNVDIRPGDTIVVSKAGIVYVLGDVGKPGGFLIENSDKLTVLQAISLAQGTSRTSSPDKSRLIRKTEGVRTETPVQIKRILADKAPDVTLLDGDILYVPGSATKNALRDVETILPGVASAAIYRVP